LSVLSYRAAAEHPDWQIPMKHVPEQHCGPDVQGAPVIPQDGAAVPQTGGLPTQLPLVHSKPAWQLVPVANGCETQTRWPEPSSEHVPWQQSAATEHSVPIARQGPGPGSQR
jgi:hypothetical protein